MKTRLKYSSAMSVVEPVSVTTTRTPPSRLPAAALPEAEVVDRGEPPASFPSNSKANRRVDDAPVTVVRQALRRQLRSSGRSSVYPRPAHRRCAASRPRRGVAPVDERTLRSRENAGAARSRSCAGSSCRKNSRVKDWPADRAREMSVRGHHEQSEIQFPCSSTEASGSSVTAEERAGSPCRW